MKHSPELVRGRSLSTHLESLLFPLLNKMELPALVVDSDDRVVFANLFFTERLFQVEYFATPPLDSVLVDLFENDTPENPVRILLQNSANKNSPPIHIKKDNVVYQLYAIPLLPLIDEPFYLIYGLPRESLMQKEGELIRKHLAHLQIISKIARNIRDCQSIETILQMVVDTIYEQKFRYHHVSIFLKRFHNGRSVLKLEAIAGETKQLFLKNYPEGYYQELETGVVGRVVSTGQTILLKDVRESDVYFTVHNLNSASELCVPIRLQNQVIGAINIESKNPMEVDHSDVIMLESIADVVALAMSNVIIMEELKSKNQQLQKYIIDVQESKEKLEQQSFELVETLEKVEQAKALIEKQKMLLEKDLRMASELQKSLLPREFPSNSRLRFQYHYQPNMNLGGDFFDVAKLPGKHLGILIADVSGHGVSSAIIAAMLKAFYSNYQNRFIQPERLLSHLNKEFSSILTTGDYLTAFYMVIHLPTMTAQFSNAGHPPILLYQHRKNAIVKLTADGFFLGVFPNTKFQAQKIELQKGDRLLFYTDGIIECMNSKQAQYGIGRLKNDFQMTRTMPIESALEKIYRNISRFHGNQQFDDDITLLIAEVVD